MKSIHPSHFFAACSLVGKVNYFWGGKSSAIGWDNEWGKLKTVSAEGNKTTGTKRPVGLNCSGCLLAVLSIPDLMLPAQDTEHKDKSPNILE